MTRFGITYINKDGNRTIVDTFDTEIDADKYLNNFLENNSVETIISIYGARSLGTWLVQEIDCYKNGDSIRRVYDRVKIDEYLDFKRCANCRFAFKNVENTEVIACLLDEQPKHINHRCLKFAIQ